MVVHTETPSLMAARRLTVELLLSDHPVNCLVCRKNQRCDLQHLAAYLGITERRLTPTGRVGLIDDSNPFFERDPEKCILCGRCVRACAEITQVNAIDFLHRGFATKIGAFLDQPLAESRCVYCGECLATCPTGALVEKSYYALPTREVHTVCPYCGCGCSMYLQMRGDRIVSVRGDPANEASQGHLCVKGRFGWDFVHHPDRLKTPLIRKDGRLQPASWDEALDLVADKFAHNLGAFAVMASAKCTNEENYLLQKFARAVMSTNNIDHCARRCHSPSVAGLATALGSGAMTNTIADLERAGAILLIGSNTTDTHPIAALRIKKAVREHSAKLIVVNPRYIDLCEDADLWLQLRSGSDVALLNGLAWVILHEGLWDEGYVSERTDGFDEWRAVIEDYTPKVVERITGITPEDLISAARIYARPPFGHSAVAYTLGITLHSHGTDNVLATANLAMLTGNIGVEGGGVNPLRGQNNVQGACDMGALPNVYTAYQSVTDAAVRAKFEAAWGVGLPAETGLTEPEIMAAAGGAIKALYIVGENPAVSDADATHIRQEMAKLDFLVVQDIFLSETAQMADVILPGASFAEKDGTFTNTERLVQRVREALPPIADSRADWRIVASIARRVQHRLGLLDGGFDFVSPGQIMDEIASLTPSYGGISYSRLASGPLQWPCPTADYPGTQRLHVGRFTRGRGRFTPTIYRLPAEVPDAEYPFILNTGRLLYHFHTGTLTRRVEGLDHIAPEAKVEINPNDAQELGISDGEIAKVVSRRGEVQVRASLTDNTPPGTVFMVFHFAEALTNALTSPALDPVAKAPELKVCAVRVERMVER
jgi:formate dehydrogenase alpha subunit